MEKEIIVILIICRLTLASFASRVCRLAIQHKDEESD